MIKRCYDCNEVLERHDLFSIPSFNDKVVIFNYNKKILNFRFGSCAIILSRKYAYVIIAMFVVFYCVYGLNK